MKLPSWWKWPLSGQEWYVVAMAVYSLAGAIWYLCWPSSFHSYSIFLPISCILLATVYVVYVGIKNFFSKKD